MGEVDDLLKLTRAGKNFFQMLEAPKTNQAIQQLSTNMSTLSGELSRMNNAILEQNAQVRESIKQTREEAKLLREELKELSGTSEKSHSLFQSMERAITGMEKSGAAAEDLAIAAVIVSGIGLFGTFYPVFTDMKCGEAQCDALTAFAMSVVTTALVFASMVFVIGFTRGHSRKK